MSASQIKLGTSDHFLDVSASSCGPAQQEQSGFVIIRRPTLMNQYCLVAVVPISEIVAPIEAQRTTIEDTAVNLSLLTTVVLGIALLVFVAPCTLLVAWQISKPLKNTSEESSIIVRNIGGDLFKDLTIHEPKMFPGIGEVKELRERFVGMLVNVGGRERADFYCAFVPNSSYPELLNLFPGRTE